MFYFIETLMVVGTHYTQLKNYAHERILTVYANALKLRGFFYTENGMEWEKTKMGATNILFFCVMSLRIPRK